jgi:hypothetical protein
MDNIDILKTRIESINKKIMALLEERYDLEDELEMEYMQHSASRDDRPLEKISINEFVQLLPKRHQTDMIRLFVEKNICNVSQLTKVVENLNIKRHVYQCVIYVLKNRYNYDG